MSYKEQGRRDVRGAVGQPDEAKASRTSVNRPADATLDRGLRQMAEGDYEKALNLLLAAGKSPPIINARGVCLLRLGRPEAAIRAFRDLVLNPGSTWTRPDVPTHYKTNYATALLMGGHPSGCLDVLREINNEAHPAVERLRAAVKRWESSLPLLRRLNWRLGRLEPSNCKVSIDFTPGDLEEQPSSQGIPPVYPTMPPT